MGLKPHQLFCKSPLTTVVVFVVFVVAATVVVVVVVLVATRSVWLTLKYVRCLSVHAAEISDASAMTVAK